MRADVDHDGDPVLRIDADYTYMKEPIDVYATVGLVSDMRDVLERVDEFRFPHIRHNFDERQQTTKLVKASKRAKLAKTG